MKQISPQQFVGDFSLERKLHAARRGVSGTKYQTGLVIDLNGPAGNIFSLMGMCNRLVRELGLSVQPKREYKTEINSAGDCQSRLTIMQKWFGIVFVGGQ